MKNHINTFKAGEIVMYNKSYLFEMKKLSLEGSHGAYISELVARNTFIVIEDFSSPADWRVSCIDENGSIVHVSDSVLEKVTLENA
jgi:hypothetical protein